MKKKTEKTEKTEKRRGIMIFFQWYAHFPLLEKRKERNPVQHPAPSKSTTYFTKPSNPQLFIQKKGKQKKKLIFQTGDRFGGIGKL
jgi:hypothetical protein